MFKFYSISCCLPGTFTVTTVNFLSIYTDVWCSTYYNFPDFVAWYGNSFLSVNYTQMTLS